ncbi:MAG: P-loop NTPase, partial [Bacteroidales bacterium]|nr:P-loop NTPase [Bacteroidales bacterium]
AGNVLKQFIEDSDWGELDVLVIDMPPGTSDIQLTLCQIINITGAIMVGTPQDVAVIDVVKAIDFFQKEKIEVPILGLIENMAWFTPEELPNNKYYIFGKGGVEELAKKQNLPFLGAVPIVMGLREGGDKGVPAAMDEQSIVGKQFAEIAKKIMAY